MKISAGLRVTLSIVVVVLARFDSARCHPVGEQDSYQSNPLLPSSQGQGETSAAPPPLIFPSGSSDVYKIVENDTALKILQARAAVDWTDENNGQHTETTEGRNVQQRQEQQQQTLTATSLVDGAADESAAINGNNVTDVSQPESTPPPPYNSNSDGDKNNDSSSNVEDADGDDDDYSSEEDDDGDDDDEEDDDDGTIDSDVVNVQPEDPNKEDGLEEQFGNKDSHFPLVIDNTVIEVSAMRQEHVWVIVTGAIFVLTLTAYIAMVLYRNRLERRYGMRQRLVTEDDYYTNNDI